VVNNDVEVRQLARSDDPWLNGFYMPRAGGSLAVVPSQNAKAGDAERSLTTLLHEYAHHFSISISSSPPPLWFAEGSAEFFASATFKSSGEVRLGEHAENRVRELRRASQITARDVLDTSGTDRSGSTYLGFYAKSWLLYHYLVFEPRRQGQLAQYLAAITAGTRSLDAAQNAFGDLDVLERELDEYASRRKFYYFAVPADAIRPSPVTIQGLPAGESAAMQIRIRLRVGTDRQKARELSAQTRAIAAQFPRDPGVLSTLAEAERSAGDDRGAITAADAALAIDPARIDGYLQKGLALFDIAESTGDAGDFAKARDAFAALSAREPDHPLPLAYSFRSYLAQGEIPPPQAMQLMQRAVDLAPFDRSLRMSLARQQVRQGQADAARANLLPIANDPHGGSRAAEARSILASLNAKPESAPVDRGEARGPKVRH